MVPTFQYVCVLHCKFFLTIFSQSSNSVNFFLLDFSGLDVRRNGIARFPGETDNVRYIYLLGLSTPCLLLFFRTESFPFVMLQ